MLFARRQSGFRDLQVSHQSKGRLAAALFVGTILCLIVIFASQIIPFVLFHLPSQGSTFAIVGMLQFTFGILAVAFALYIAKLRFSDIGLVFSPRAKEILLGTGIAGIYALIQFLIIIPNTGGAARSDIVAAGNQVGESLSSLAWFFVYEPTAVFFEEIFFRGLFFTLLVSLFGNSRIALFSAVVTTTVFFGLLHGYQGWAGMIDTGLFGGLLLTLIYLWRGTLTACYTAHLLWNLTAICVIYFWY